MFTSIEEWIDAELHPLLVGHAITGNAKAMEEEEVLQAWTLLRFANDHIAARLDELRELLLADAKEFGKETDKGGQRLYVGRHLILREKRVAKLPEAEGFKALMETANLKLDQAYTKQTKTILDPSKIENLVNLGKLAGKEVNTLKKVTWALRVKPDQDLETVLDEAFGEGDEELPDVQPRAKRSTSDGSRKS